MYQITPDLLAKARAFVAKLDGELRDTADLQGMNGVEFRRACRSLGNAEGWLAVAEQRGETRLSLEQIQKLQLN